MVGFSTALFVQPAIQGQKLQLLPPEEKLRKVLDDTCSLFLLRCWLDLARF